MKNDCPKRVLTVDRGNTSIKLSVFENGEKVLMLRLYSPEVSVLSQFIDEVEADGAIVCAVGLPVPDDIIAQLREKFGRALLIFDHDTHLPIAIEYRSRATLGLDRIAAVVAATDIFPGKDVVVVDAGTALTVDRVLSGGVMLGGNISPGMSMRFESLHSHTSSLPLVTADGPLPEFGIDTETAIRCGVVRGMVAEILSALEPEESMLLCGGDSRVIAPLLDIPEDRLHVTEDAVGMGLDIIWHEIMRRREVWNSKRPDII